jgi:hypothetical protein
MSCSDEGLRKRSVLSFKEFLSLFEPVSLVCLLQVLKRDCPFPKVGGLILDIVKDHSQSCSVVSVTSRSPLPLPLPLTTSIVKSSARTDQSGQSEMEDMRRTAAEDASPLHWDGSGPSIFFSEIALRAFCVPPLTKMRHASTQQILDSADEIGGAINLLLHYSIKINRILADFEANRPALIQHLCSFLGWRSDNTADITAESDAASISAIQDLFHKEMRSLVEGITVLVRSKLQKVESKINAVTVSGFLPRNPWLLPEERGGSTAATELQGGGEGEESAMDKILPSDLLQLEIILDNLEFLLRVLRSPSVSPSLPFSLTGEM